MDDSLEDMSVTLPTFHEDRSWLKAEAPQNTRRRRGRRRDQCERRGRERGGHQEGKNTAGERGRGERGID